MIDISRIEDLRRRVAQDPASIAFAQLAEEYRRAGQYQDSVDVCRTGLARHPAYLSARVTLGRALLQLGQLDAARDVLEAVHATAPDNLAVVRSLGEIHHKGGAFAHALGLFEAALALAPNDPEIGRLVGELSHQAALQAEQAERERTTRVLTVLDQWLASIHVARAQRRA